MMIGKRMEEIKMNKRKNKSKKKENYGKNFLLTKMKNHGH
jgi:hypothetical protein